MRVASDLSDESFDKANQDEKDAIAKRVDEAMNNRKDKIKTNSTSKTSVSLFNFMIKIYDEKNAPDEVLEELKDEVFDYIANDMSMSDTQTEEMLKRIANATRHGELGKILAEKVVELAEERGIPNQNLIPNQVIGQAKARTQSKNIKKEERLDGRNIFLSRVYAKMFLNSGDRAKVIGLIEQMSSTSKGEVYDFSILDKVKETDEAFYYAMIRTVGTMASRRGNGELKEKYNELLATELMEKGFNELDDFGKINAKAKIIFDEGIYNRYKNFEDSIINGSPEGLYDENLIGYIKIKDQNIYKMIVSQMEKYAVNRDDKGLLDLVEKIKSNDRENNNNQAEVDTIGKKSILTVQNLTVDEIVTIHSDGVEMFAQKHNNGQTVEDSDDGR